MNIDYHVEHDGRLYSVPHALVGERVELRVTSVVVEIFHRGGASPATHGCGARRDRPAPCPSTARARTASTARGRRRGSSAGRRPSDRRSAALVEQILLGRREPESAYRSCMALIRSAKAYDRARFDAACRRALAIGAPTRKSVLAILSTRPRRRASSRAAWHQLPLRVHHENVRGGDYYDRKETDPS